MGASRSATISSPMSPSAVCINKVSLTSESESGSNATRYFQCIPGAMASGLV